MIQLFGITIFILGLGHLMAMVPWLQPYRSVIFAALMLYVPLGLKQKIVFIETRGIFNSIRTFLLWAAIIFVPYFFLLGAWAQVMWGAKGFHPAPFPSWEAVLLQLVLVALPEETFFRGYMQTRLQEKFPPRWKIFGAKLGWGWIITCVVFAFGHSLIEFQWWHFSIFFPSLVFGYLKEKTGGLIAPILFHALSNLFNNWAIHSFQ